MIKPGRILLEVAAPIREENRVLEALTFALRKLPVFAQVVTRTLLYFYPLLIFSRRFLGVILCRVVIHLFLYIITLNSNLIFNLIMYLVLVFLPLRGSLIAGLGGR